MSSPSVQLATFWNSATPAAPTGRINAVPATDGLIPVADTSWSIANHGQVDTRTTTTETIGQAQQGKCIMFTNASATAVTVNTPTDSTFMCYVYVRGAGTCTFTPASGTISYGDLSGQANVAITTGNDGILFWDGTNWEMLNVGTGANATEIQGIPVSATAPTNGDVLEYNGSQWVPASGGPIPASLWSYLGYNAVFSGWTALGDTIQNASGNTSMYSGTNTTPNNIPCMTIGNSGSGSFSRVEGQQQWMVGNGTTSTNLHLKAYLAHTITDVRFWFGLFNNTAGFNVDNLPSGTSGAISGAGFRFSTVVPDTNWQCCTSDGTTQTTTNSGVAAVAGAFHTFEIVFTDSVPNVKFYIDGTLVATNTTHLPAFQNFLLINMELYGQPSAGAFDIYFRYWQLNSA